MCDPGTNARADVSPQSVRVNSERLSQDDVIPEMAAHGRAAG